jgi:hypothetical protein
VHKFRVVTVEREEKKSECRWYIHPVLYELLMDGGWNNEATVSRTKDDSINKILQWQCDVESILRVLNLEFGILQSVQQLATAGRTGIQICKTSSPGMRPTQPLI